MSERFLALLPGRFYFQPGTAQGYIVLQGGIAKLVQRKSVLGGRHKAAKDQTGGCDYDAFHNITS
jgi:hypothetical protein